MTIIDPHLDIDQVSAAVDGERDPAAAAHLLTCLACREQVDTWRRVLASLRDVPTAPPCDIDALLDAAPTSLHPSIVHQAGSDVTALHPAGSAMTAVHPADADVTGAGRKGPGRRAARALGVPVASHWPRLPAVAAVVALCVLASAAVVGIGRLHGGSSSAGSSASAAGAIHSASKADTSGAGAVGAGTSSSGAGTSSSGSYGGTAQLAAQLRTVVPSARAATVAPRTPCLPQASREAASGPATRPATAWFYETARLGGVDSRVFVFATGRGYVAVVVQSDTCSMLATFLF